jgi:hypothetical protein
MSVEKLGIQISLLLKNKVNEIVEISKTIAMIQISFLFIWVYQVGLVLVCLLLNV